MDFFGSKASNQHKKASIGVELHRIGIYTIYNTKKVCLCVCVCECVCLVCVNGVCDVCVCVSECVCVVFYCYL